MALLCPPLFRQDLNFLGLTLTAETANSMWFGMLSVVLTSIIICSVIQAFYVLLGWGVQRRLDPLGFGLCAAFTIALYDDVGRLLFSR